MTVTTEPGRIFREAWIAGVKAHYPGEPKAGYIAPWEETPDWERASAAAVYEQVASLLESTSGAAAHLTRTQKSQFVAAAWTAQIWQRVPDPKPGYVAEWEQLPGWQRETDADIFEAVEEVFATTC